MPVKLDEHSGISGWAAWSIKAILQINRGAEDAAGYTKPIFVDAIKRMDIGDAIGLVRNGDTSALIFSGRKQRPSWLPLFFPWLNLHWKK